MSKIAYIFFTLLITVSAVIPSNALVVCQKPDGSVSIEFMDGELCACNQKMVNDEQDKSCCLDTECHDVVEVTTKCHDDLKIGSGDCIDTELEFIEVLNTTQRLDCELLQKLSKSIFIDLTSSISIRALIKPYDVGKYFTIDYEILNYSLHLKNTTVLLI